MTESNEEADLIILARAGLSPSPADALRVRTSLTAALAAAGSGATDAAPSGSLEGVDGGTNWPLRVLVTSVAAVAVGAGGYWLGYRAGAREARPAAAQVPLAAQSAPSPDTTTRAGPAALAAGPVSPAAAGKEVGTRESSRKRSAKAARTIGSGGVGAATESLSQEVRALRAVERALRDNRPSLALAILQQLDRDVPQGKLIEERRATYIVARCISADVPFGLDLAEDFANDYSESVYLERVRQSCARRSEPKQRP